MYELPEFKREELKEEIFQLLCDYEARHFDKRIIASIIESEAEAAAGLYAWKVATSYADYVRNQDQKMKERRSYDDQTLEDIDRAFKALEEIKIDSTALCDITTQRECSYYGHEEAREIAEKYAESED